MIHIQVDLIVYLRTNPAVVYGRTMTRGCPEEKQVPLKYIQQLHDLHESWLLGGTDTRPAPVLELSANLDVTGIVREYQRAEKVILRMTGAMDRSRQRGPTITFEVTSSNVLVLMLQPTKG